MFDVVETPSVIIDMGKVESNVREMARAAVKYRCSIRPHIKTHKIPELAKMQLAYGACGITCAKVSEAEVMAEAGIGDIFIAYPVIGAGKIKRVLELSGKVRLILGVDSMEGARALSDAAAAAGMVLEIRMEVDTGLRRTGVPYEKAVDFARELIGLPGLKLTGIYTFRGLVLDGKPTDQREAAGRQEGEVMAELAERLRKEGMEIRDVSGGSTPTGRYVAQVEGVTEVRPGTYIFNDMMQVKMGAATIDQCAASVLVTVVSTPSEDLAVVDGGSKTFATDISMGSFPHFLEGYGKIVGGDGLTGIDPITDGLAGSSLARPLHVSDDLVLERVNEEHGMIRSKSGKTNLKVGQRLLIIPNHVCSTVNLHNNVYFLEQGGSLRKVEVEARGRLY